jgi:hypothetical protein
VGLLDPHERHGGGLGEADLKGTPLAEDTVSQAGGVPFPSPTAGPVTPFSLEVYAQLKDWAEARYGVWERWEPSYLVLTISTVEGEPVDPVVIDTWEEELSITLGYWESHSGESEVTPAATEMRGMAEKWLAGALSTAVYTGADGKWCGSRIIEEPEIPNWLADVEWIKYFAPTHVEIRRARKSEWRRFAIVDDKLTESPRAQNE